MRSDNPLAVYQLSATLARHLFPIWPGTAQVNRKSVFWIGHLALVGLVSIGVTPADAAQRAQRPLSQRPRNVARRLFRRALAVAQGEARPRPRSCDGARDGRHGPAALQGGRERRPGAGCARGCRHHLRPRDQSGPLGRERPEPALDRQHHQGDDRDRLPREQSRPQRSSVTIDRSDVFQASTTHLRANDKVTADDLLHLLLIASDNAAARALARVSPHGSRRASSTG